MYIKEQLLDYIDGLEIEIYVNQKDDTFLLNEYDISLKQLQDIEYQEKFGE